MTIKKRFIPAAETAPLFFTGIFNSSGNRLISIIFYCLKASPAATHSCAADSFSFDGSTDEARVIFLSGGGAKLFAFKEMLVGALGIETEYWDPFKKITLASSVEIIIIWLMRRQLFAYPP